MANNYFSDLFTSSQVAMSRSQEISNNPTLSFEDQCALNVTLNNSEIWNTFKCINPYKAPGASIFKFARLLKPNSQSLDSCIYNATADNYLIQFVDKCTAEHQIRLRSFLLHM